MRRLIVLIVPAIILASSVFHAGATTAPNVQILFREDEHIPAGQTCTRHTSFFVPPLVDGSVSGVERMAQVQGTSSVWVVGVRIQPLTATGGNYQTCLNAPAPAGGVNVLTMFFGIAAS